MTRLLSFALTALFFFTTATALLAQVPSSDVDPRVVPQGTEKAVWEAPLLAQLELAKAGPEAIKQATPVIERIALGNPEAWIPNYYAARVVLIEHYMAGEEGCIPCVEKMDRYLTIAEKADNNSEVMTLRASYYQTMLSIYPMRAPYYAPKASNLLQKAIAADPTNPRAESKLGQNYYYTPAMFGGGPAKAIPYLEKAVELFNAEAALTDRDNLLPTWGADRAKAMYGRAVVESN